MKEIILEAIQGENTDKEIKSALMALDKLEREAIKKIYLLLTLSLLVITPSFIDISHTSSQIKISTITLPDINTIHKVASLYFPFIFMYIINFISSSFPIDPIKRHLINMLRERGKLDIHTASKLCNLSIIGSELSNLHITSAKPKNKLIGKMYTYYIMSPFSLLSALPLYAMITSAEYSKSILPQEHQATYIIITYIIIFYAVFTFIFSGMSNSKIIERLTAPQTPAAQPDHPDTTQPE